jgi:nucleoside phosphorylase
LEIGLVTPASAQLTRSAPTFGIVTALPVEYAAVLLVGEQRGERRVHGDPNHYVALQLPSTDPGRPHLAVVTLLIRDGTAHASAASADLIRSFPTVRCVVMSGIAGGVPAPDNPPRHVRLGDIVVASKGVVDYGHVRVVDGDERPRRPVAGISSRLLQAANRLHAGEYREDRPWERWLAEADIPVRFARPPEWTDVLYAGGITVPHPSRRQSGHPETMPKVHYAAIASADQLLRDEHRRDRLATGYGVVAVEMEASGIAAGSFTCETPWFVVRGIADYCENVGKNDRWHGYAALVAAAYLRALLGVCPPFDTAHVSPPGGVGEPFGVRESLVDALLDVPTMRAEHTRQLVVERLPQTIAGAIRRFPAARTDTHEILTTCLDFPGGIAALLAAVRAVAGDSLAVRRLAEALQPYLDR